MNYREALDEVITRFRLKAVDIAEATGVGQNQISRFRNGHNDLNAESFFKIIHALPPKAKMHFYALLMMDDCQQE